MNFKIVMVIKALVCLFFGPLLLLAPGTLLTFLGTTCGAGAALTARLYGAAVSGTIFLTWIGRNTENSQSQRAMIWHLFVYDLIGFVVTLVFILSGALNLLGCGIVAVYLFFSVGFGYLLLSER